MLNQKIVILGGGTAGFLAAVFCKKTDPAADVKLVKSSEIPSIGVGEGSTPQLLSFLESIGISKHLFFAYADATVKNGILFANWNGDGKSYFHPFAHNLIDYSINNVFVNGCFDQYIKNAINADEPIGVYSYGEALSKVNKVDPNRLTGSIHFDAGKTATLLERMAVSLGVQVIQSTYVDAELDENGYISNLLLSDGKKMRCDFVIDASGLARELIGKRYQQRWISFSDSLPMKKAIPFWLSPETETKPYTTSTALDYGWMWKIPTQSRIGAGYVFDSDFTSVEAAALEVETVLGHPIEVRKEIDFSPGLFENVWVKNCVAVGLASSFVEPLEATSIAVTCQQLERLRFNFFDLKNAHPHVVDSFNKSFRSGMEEIEAFLYLHYVTKRKSSEFWADFLKNNKMPTLLESVFDAVKSGQMFWFSHQDFSSFMAFPQISYLFVAAGLGLIEQRIKTFDQIKPSLNQSRQIIADSVALAQTHNEYIKEAKNCI